MKTIIFLALIMPIFLFVATSFAETEYNLTMPTGLPGTTSQPYCNTTADCGGNYQCFLDYDLASNAISKGWCYPTGINCAHYASSTDTPTFTAHGSSVCRNTTMLQSCSNGAWSNSTCASGYTCSSGACTSSGGNDGNGGGGNNNNNTNNNTQPSIYSLIITTSPNSFDIVQGESILESLTVNNDGEKNLTSVSLSISGINSAWYTITPSTFSLNIGESKTFTINFTIPTNASVNSYSITASVTSEHSDASDSAVFTIRVLPSSETVQNTIIPLYEDYLSQLNDMENQIKSLKESGKNTTDLEIILNSIKEKLNQTNSSLTDQDYFAASRFLDDAKALIDELTAKIQETSGITIGTGSSIFIIAAVAVIIVIAVIAYLYVPRGKEYGTKDYSTNIIPKLGGEDKVDKIVEKIKNIKRKKGEQKYKYEFKR